MARFYGPVGSGGGGGDIADFIFINEDEDNSTMTLPINKELTIETTRDDDNDADINIRSADDVFITAQGDDISLDAFNEVNISTGDDGYQWTFSDSGCIRLPGNGEICNPVSSSGDGLGRSTISINPDTGTESNQYIIIDPTAPNHIHIRAGGNIDESGADLFLGGEKNNVVVSDSARDVFINTRPETIINSYTNLNESSDTNFIVSSEADINFDYIVNVNGTDFVVNSITPVDEGTVAVTASGAVFTAGQSYTFTYNPPWTNSWQFGSDAVLYGPAMGGLIVTSLNGAGQDYPLGIFSNDRVLLNGTSGEFLNDADVPSNQIATIGDVAAVATLYHGSFYSTQNQSTSVNTPIAMTFNQTDFSSGVDIENNSEITIVNAGKYNIQFSAQLYHLGGGGNGKTVSIWLAKNGNPVAHSNTKVTAQPDYPHAVAAWNFFVDAAAGDYYELMWATDNASISILHENAGAYPAIPSVILTVNQIA